jgi:hypothetical protein
MSRPSVDTEVVKLSTTAAVCGQLDQLVDTGMFGKTRAEVAEQLLREKLRELIEKGWPKRGQATPTPSDT